MVKLKKSRDTHILKTQAVTRRDDSAWTTPVDNQNPMALVLIFQMVQIYIIPIHPSYVIHSKFWYSSQSASYLFILDILGRYTL